MKKKAKKRLSKERLEAKKKRATTKGKVPCSRGCFIG